MQAASPSPKHAVLPGILQRRARLLALAASVPPDDLSELLAEIDDALEKIEKGLYGLCETCHDPIEPDRIESDPMVRFCLDHLSEQERAAHQQDLELATEIQARLLPPQDLTLEHWEAHYRYEPAGAVGGDYCELIAASGGHSLFFAVGDVAGKGVAASLLMTHLSAIFRSLLSLDLPLAEVVSRANRLFAESTGASHYATLVCGHTTPDGVDLANAGHCKPLLLREDATERIDSTGLPLGLFAAGRHEVKHIRMADGDSLVLYSDGITEAQNGDGDEYGEERLIRSLRTYAGRNARAAPGEILNDVARFRGPRPLQDDMTVLIVRKNLISA